MFFESDSSMSTMYKRITFFSASLKTYDPVLPLPLCFSTASNPELPCLALEFSVALKALPRSYGTTADAQAFRDFFSEYGTHIADQASVGGAALSQSFYHSCMLVTDQAYAYSHVSSSFFIVYADVKAHGHGYNKTDKLFAEWSVSYASLLGGAPNPFGLLPVDFPRNT